MLPCHQSLSVSWGGNENTGLSHPHIIRIAETRLHNDPGELLAAVNGGDNLLV